MKSHLLVWLVSAFFKLLFFASSSSAVQWVELEGKVSTPDDTPLCAMVLANGQHVFSCSPAGEYSLSLPLDEFGEITLFCFVEGLVPYKAVLEGDPGVHDIVMSTFPGRGLDFLEKIYPMYTDMNENGINDYVEAGSHYSGIGTGTARKAAQEYGSFTRRWYPGDEIPRPEGGFVQGPALVNHAFLDENKDGICDYSQNGSATWHGPGFVDEDGDGICDYWDADTPWHNRHQGIWFYDQNRNQINDLFEEKWHIGGNHEFYDGNGDGICDYAQSASPAWHGPGFVDKDKDNTCDLWQKGGKGYGGPHHGNE